MPHHLAYYITAHGFGHAVRSLEVIKELQRADPDAAITIVSAIPSFLIAQNLEAPRPQRQVSLDVGLVQRDSLRFDLEATLEALTALKNRQQVLLDEELRFFERERITAIVADVPFLPLVAAARYGIASIGLGNFTWDWIYQHYAAGDSRWRELVGWIREAYRQCGLFLQLPMHGDCSVCPRIRSVPLVARRARRGRRDVREILGIAETQRAYLISFVALDLSREAQRRIQAIPGSVFLYRAPLRFQFTNGYCVDDAKVSYAELVAAVDAVITKPGYGIVADCLTQGTALIYTDRGDFPEYPILEREMREWLPTVYLPSEELYAGNWESALRELSARTGEAPWANVIDGETVFTPPEEGFRTDGARVCAHAILDYIRF